jgi:hypothetical protein
MSAGCTDVSLYPKIALIVGISKLRTVCRVKIERYAQNISKKLQYVFA